MHSVNRREVAIHTSLASADDGGFMPGTEAERLAAVWELTREVWAFVEKQDAERRLQRHVSVLDRREG